MMGPHLLLALRRSVLRCGLTLLSSLGRLFARRCSRCFLALCRLPPHTVQRHRRARLCLALRAEPFPVRNGVQRWVKALEVIRVVALVARQW
ncbi:hypothetical protein BD414DRAFT_489128 [Trametes punicea]|nr:hypothetical protein BD414DRAFT_489128 [Trametes punicea]